MILVLLTLFGALPVYRRVAAESPHGQGSIAMLERLLPFWRGKLFVLVLLGFALTDFIITITLSAADASAHLVENPHVPAFLHGQELWITLGLVALLGAVFLKGFTEAIGVAVVLVATYLALNAVVIAVSAAHVVRDGHLVSDWTTSLTAEHGNVALMVAVSLTLFPKLALGLSGFETGRRGDEPRAGRPGRRPREAGHPDPQHQAAAHHRRLHHERLPDRLQPGHHAPDPGARVRGAAAPPTAARWPTSRTATSAAASARRTTSRPSSSCGSRAPRRWRACST